MGFNSMFKGLIRNAVTKLKFVFSLFRTFGFLGYLHLYNVHLPTRSSFIAFPFTTRCRKVRNILCPRAHCFLTLWRLIRWNNFLPSAPGFISNALQTLSTPTNAQCYIFMYFTRWRSWLRHCATNRKVKGSIPDGVIWIFHWHNPSGHSMALGLTQPLTEMSTRNVSWGCKGGRCVGLTTLPPSCADWLEIWESRPPGILWACPDL